MTLMERLKKKYRIGVKSSWRVSVKFLANEIIDGDLVDCCGNTTYTRMPLLIKLDSNPTGGLTTHNGLDVTSGMRKYRSNKDDCRYVCVTDIVSSEIPIKIENAKYMKEMLQKVYGDVK